jgi:hypothetical protein
MRRKNAANGTRTVTKEASYQGIARDTTNAFKSNAALGAGRRTFDFPAIVTHSQGPYLDGPPLP